jgi:hypothetical protein
MKNNGNIVKMKQSIKTQNPEVCIAGTTGYYGAKITHFLI